MVYLISTFFNKHFHCILHYTKRNEKGACARENITIKNMDKRKVFRFTKIYNILLSNKIKEFKIMKWKLLFDSVNHEETYFAAAVLNVFSERWKKKRNYLKDLLFRR